MSDEKVSPVRDGNASDLVSALPVETDLVEAGGAADTNDDGEVFKTNVNGVEFRTMGWKKTAIILLKLQFATGVLSVPAGLSVLGAVPGVIVLVTSGILSSYFAFVLGNFRNKHPGIHSLPDVAFYIAVLTAGFASIRKISNIGVLTWFGFGSIFTAIFIVVVAVTQVTRPAAAPQTGEYDLGVVAVGYPTFVAGLSSALTLFSSFGATSTFLPVLAEMREPKAFKKPLVVSMSFLVTCYVTFGIVVYVYCGRYVASPALGSAGRLIGKISYGIAIPGLIITSTLWLHVAAKYVFVKILRNSEHLQANTKTHWITWLSCTFGVTLLSFLVAEAVPFFNYLLSFVGSLCAAPTVLGVPCSLWLYENRADLHGSLTRKLVYSVHAVILLASLFLMIAGTYTSVQSIVDAYKSNAVGSAFSCADNS